MYDHVNRTKDFPASLLIEEEKQGDCDVRIRYNPYDLNNMEAELFDAPVELSIPGLPEQPSFADYHNLDVRLIAKGSNVCYTAKLRPVSLSNLKLRLLQQKHSKTIPVKEYSSNQWWDTDEQEVRLSVAYRFPLTTALKSRGIATLDSKYGYYRGEREPGDKTIKVNEDSFVLDTSVGEAEFYESFDISKDDECRTYPAVMMIRRSECIFQVTCRLSECDEKIEDIRKQINQLLRILSFTEQDRIRWTTEHVTITTLDSESVRRTKTYRWASPTSDNYRPGHSGHREARKGFTAIWGAYRSLGNQKRAIIDQAFQNMSSASCTGIIETQLIAYHACLDHDQVTIVV